MRLEKSPANVVVVARQFNPSIITQYWLIKNGILSEEDFEIDSCVFSPIVADVRTKEFHILIVPEQFQFSPIVATKEIEARLIMSKMGKIIETLSHTPFTAVGLNFTWNIDAEDKGMSALSRGLFFRQESYLYKEFDTKDACFGAYLSKDALGCRLHLKIKPIIIIAGDQQLTRLQFSFNYHLELKGDEKVTPILELFSKWVEASDLANSMVQKAIQEKL